MEQLVSRVVLGNAIAYAGAEAVDQLKLLVSRAFEEDAIGGVFGYRWEAANLSPDLPSAPLLVRILTPEGLDVSQFDTVIVDSGNTSGDVWKYVYHAAGFGMFVQEA